MNHALTTAFPADPYPGLRPFEPNEWAIFCGREAMVLQVIDLLGNRNVALVHGSSGCGKSSLVRAGVLPAIARDHGLAGRPFDYAIFRPSEGPLRGLARLFSDKLGAPKGEDAHEWWANQLIFSRQIIQTIEDRIKARGLDSFCLVVDQFEEVFHWIRERGDADVGVLVDMLCQLGQGEAGRHFFALMTMRTDYLGECARFPAMGNLINSCQYFLPNLDDRGLYRAIHDPAALFNGSIEPALADRLRIEASGKQDQLPVLQHLLMRMTGLARKAGQPWQLTLQHFESVQGVHGALSNHADAIFADVLARQPGAQDAIGWIFRALIDLDVGGRVVRRRCTVNALTKVSNKDASFVRDVVSAFSARGADFLVVSDPGEGEAQKIVDISHEALIRRWTRMIGDGGKDVGWVSREFQDGLVWRSTAVAARNEKACLDPVTTIERERWFQPFLEAPERARRYLITAEGRQNITEEHEWRSVRDLLVRSRAAIDRETARMKRKAIMISIALFLALVAVASAGFKKVGTYRAEQELATSEKDAATREVTELKQTTAQVRQELLTQVAKDSETVPSKVAEVLEQSAVQRSDVTVTAVTVSNVSQAPPPTISGFMWIGDSSKHKLRLGSTEVGPDQIQKGGWYESRDNIVLREGPPQAGNVSAKAIGLVRTGSTVEALGEPVAVLARGGSKQYWLNVQVVTFRGRPPTRLYVHFSRDSTDVAARLVESLKKAGFVVEANSLVENARPGLEVRYCYEQDDAKASSLSRNLSDLVDAEKKASKARVRYIGHIEQCRLANPGTLEVWIGAL